MKTVENLVKAFMGESMARTRCSMYAAQAQEEGFERVAAVFPGTADREREHASQLFKALRSIKCGEAREMIAVGSDACTVYARTVENLRSAIEGEHHEHSSMYPEYADVAEAEGHKVIAFKMRAISKAEVHHGERFQKLLRAAEPGTAFKKDREVWWVCRSAAACTTGPSRRGSALPAPVQSLIFRLRQKSTRRKEHGRTV